MTTLTRLMGEKFLGLAISAVVFSTLTELAYFPGQSYHLDHVEYQQINVTMTGKKMQCLHNA